MDGVTDREWEGFLSISRYAGMREDIVQAGGGNSSAKVSSEKMYIKASGYSMAEVSEKKGFSVVNPGLIASCLESGKEISEEEAKEAARDALISGERPSIEVFLHAITGKYTLHSHPLAVNIMTSREQGEEELRELFPEAVFVGYTAPGAGLADKCNRLCKGRKANIIFLQNHGLIVSANAWEEVLSETEYVLKRLEAYLHLDMECYRNTTSLYNLLCRHTGKTDKLVFPAQDRRLSELFKENGNEIWKHDFCPDCVVYCANKICVLKKNFEEQGLSRFIQEYGEPTVLLYEGEFYIAAENWKKCWEIQSVLSFSGLTAAGNKGIKMKYLNESEKNFLLNWDAEKYRKNKG